MPLINLEDQIHSPFETQMPYEENTVKQHQKNGYLSSNLEDGRYFYCSNSHKESSAEDSIQFLKSKADDTYDEANKVEGRRGGGREGMQMCPTLLIHRTKTEGRTNGWGGKEEGNPILLKEEEEERRARPSVNGHHLQQTQTLRTPLSPLRRHRPHNSKFERETVQIVINVKLVTPWLWKFM